MTDSVGSVSPASAESAPADLEEEPSVNASDVTTSAQEHRGENFSNMASEAFKSGMKPFGTVNPIQEQRNDLVQGGTGAVGQEKGSVVSEVTGPGAEPPPEPTPEDASLQLVDRLNGLYMDIAVHHVAWGVAQRMQKDMSQLLRGS